MTIMVPEKCKFIGLEMGTMSMPATSFSEFGLKTQVIFRALSGTTSPSQTQEKQLPKIQINVNYQNKDREEPELYYSR